MANAVTISGRIARHDQPVFAGRITIDRVTGRILRVEEGMYLEADYAFGRECLIFAGFGDVHIHAREDNTGKHCYKEDYATATAAALNGGVVHVSAMPNTPDPVTGGQQLGWHRAHISSHEYPVVVINYLGVDATTEPLGGRDDPYKCYFGKSVGTLSVIYAGELDRILARYSAQRVSFHVEYEPIVLASAHGKTHSDRRPIECVNEGLRLLLPLIEKYGIKAKLCHWSTGGESFALIHEYRKRGCDIELEVSPLHLYFDTAMTENNPSLWTKIQMNPAVQSLWHRQALIEGLRTGFIQYLATDHAPHTEEEKFSAFVPFKERYRDMTNKEVAETMCMEEPELFLETCVKNNHSGAPWLDTYGAICCWLMHEHGFTAQDIARVAAYNPGRFVNRFLASQYPGRDFSEGFGDIAEGYMGSLTVLNTHTPTLIDRKNLKTKVGWSALEGHVLPGRVEAVFIEGVKQ